MKRTVDDRGRVIFDSDDAIELLLRGYNITDLWIRTDETIMQYNRACLSHNKADYIISQPDTPDIAAEQETRNRQEDWWMPEAYRTLNVRDMLLSQCKTPAQITRVTEEMDLFEAHDFIPILRLLCYLVDQWRSKGVVWGVGRGSSVASYCLYLIGIHRIDSLAYNLNINEFLRPS